MSVDIAQIIPTGTRPLRHRICFATSLASVLIDNVQPVARPGKRRFPAVTRFEILDFRQEHRQILVVKRGDFAVFPMDDRERFTPVTLAAEKPVAELVIDGRFADAVRFEPSNHLGDAFLFRKSVQGKRFVCAVDVFAVRRPARFAGENFRADIFGATSIGLHDAVNRKPKLFGEIKIAGIVRRNRHDGSRPVARENVIGNPDGNLCTG